MPVSKFKVVAGSVSVAVALGAGTAIAGADSDGQTDSSVDLNDVVQVSDVQPAAPMTIDASVAQALEALDEDSVASPFDQDEVLDAQETVDEAAVDQLETGDDVDDVATAVDADTAIDTVDDQESVDSIDTADDTQDSVDTADETNDTSDGADETNDTP